MRRSKEFFRVLAWTLTAVLGVAVPGRAVAQDAGTPAAAAAGQVGGVTLLGPPPPEPPAVMVRDASGQVTVRTMRVPSPLVIDGVLDEAPYRDVPPMTDFVQQEPAEGKPATDRTEVWVFFDDMNL